MPATIYNLAYRDLVQKLVSSRVRHGLTQSKVGDILGLSSSWVSSVERCVIKVDIVMFCRLCRVYAISASQLIGDLESELKS